MTLAVAVDEGSGPLIVLLHGFPEGPSCWRHQVGPLCDAGYRVVVPWLRGYGASPAPADPAAYTADVLADEVAELIEDCGQEQAVLVGHDWGAALTWQTAALRPDRVAALAALSIPYTARSTAPPLTRLRETFGEDFFYMLYFQQPGVADAELGGDVARFLRSIYASASGSPPAGAMAPRPSSGSGFLDQLPDPGVLPDFCDPQVFAEAVEVFTRTGFTGGLNYYRAMDLTWHAVPQLGVAPITAPAAFIAGEKDLTLLFTPLRAMGPPQVSDLRLSLLLPGVGHWVQQEAPEAVTSALLGFLAGL